jgi:hypothetical protein
MTMSLNDAAHEYRRAHWGIDPDVVWTVNEPHLPRFLVEMGILTELHVRIGGKGPIQRFVLDDDDQSHVAYANDASRRLWLVLSDDAKKEMAAFVASQDLPVANLRDVAAAVGGRQARYTSPNIRVAVLGSFTNIQYFTEKKGDGPSEYNHKMGEHGGIEPYLCVGAGGRLYVAGGTYNVEPRGIVR